MGGRQTDEDDDTRERHTDTQTHKTLSQLGCLPHIQSGWVGAYGTNYAIRATPPPVAPPRTHGAKGTNKSGNNTIRRQGTPRVRLQLWSRLLLPLS